jgi:hypothetical protein
VTTRFNELASAYLAEPLMQQFGESVVFRPRGAAARTITAIVSRSGPEDQSGGPSATIEVRDDATAGISLDELNRGEDQIELPFAKPGDTSTRRKIVGFSNAVGGMITLEVR